MKCSISHTQCELIDVLVSNGARTDARNNDKSLPIHVAISNRRLCHVRKLLSLRSPVNVENSFGQSPIVTALECKDDAFVDCLLYAGASFQPSLTLPN